MTSHVEQALENLHLKPAVARSANAGTVTRFCWDGRTGEHSWVNGTLHLQDLGCSLRYPCPAVPWTMVTGPDENLYIAVDVEYDVGGPTNMHGLGKLQ